MKISREHTMYVKQCDSNKIRNHTWKASQYKKIAVLSVPKCTFLIHINLCHDTTTILRPFFRDHPGETVPEENFWTLWCKGRLTQADTDQPAGRHSIWTNQCPPPTIPPFFLQAGCHSCRPTNSVKALKATSAFGLGRRR